MVEDDTLACCRRIGHGDRGQQRPRVRMRRRREDGFCFSDLDDPAQIHHRDPPANVAHEPEIVRDEQLGQFEPLLQIHQQVYHLGLHRYVERGDRFIGNNE